MKKYTIKSKLNWDDLRFFLHVVRTKNLTQSALDLKVSQSTIARRITSLEEDLKISLFTRHQTGYFLTEAGKDITKYAEEVEAKIMSLQHTVSTFNTEITGTVRLATAENIATAILIPALPKLYQQYPALQIEIITGLATVGFLRHEVDIALRFIRPEQDNLLVRRVGQMAYSIFAHKNYLDQFPKSDSRELNRYKFISWDSSYSHLPSARWLLKNVPAAQSSLVISSVSAQIAAVQAGLGAAVLPHFLVANSHGFIPISESVFIDDLWLVSYSELRTSKNIRVVIDFIVNELNKSLLGT